MFRPNRMQACRPAEPEASQAREERGQAEDRRGVLGPQERGIRTRAAPRAHRERAARQAGREPQDKAGQAEASVPACMVPRAPTSGTPADVRPTARTPTLCAFPKAMNATARPSAKPSTRAPTDSSAPRGCWTSGCPPTASSAPPPPVSRRPETPAHATPTAEATAPNPSPASTGRARSLRACRWGPTAARMATRARRAMGHRVAFRAYSRAQPPQGPRASAKMIANPAWSAPTVLAQ
jgi:hypothetical protein